jgi:hypothetical protein
MDTISHQTKICVRNVHLDLGVMVLPGTRALALIIAYQTSIHAQLVPIKYAVDVRLITISPLQVQFVKNALLVIGAMDVQKSFAFRLKIVSTVE